MWEIIKAGGPVMWPIIALSIGATAILLERLWSLQERRVIPPELRVKVWKLVETGQLTDRHIAALEQNSALGQILAAGLANRNRPQVRPERASAPRNRTRRASSPPTRWRSRATTAPARPPAPARDWPACRD